MISRAKAVALVVAAVALMIDQATKAWVLSSLGEIGHSVPLFGPIDLTLTMNHSNAFGLTPIVGDWTRWGLSALNLTVAGVLLFVIVRRPLRPLTALGVACIAAGALGNVIDRIRLGAVIDFIDATRLGFPWIFNVADATLDIGIALVVLSTLLARPSKDA